MRVKPSTRRANHRTPVKPDRKKYSAFQNYKQALYPLPSRPTRKGRSAERHERGTGMRWTQAASGLTRDGRAGGQARERSAAG